jgi:UDP-glucose 4-epimerase
MKALVVGGAGYVGSHVVHEMLSRGYGVEVLDNLSTGYRDLLPPAIQLHVGDAYDQAFVGSLLRGRKFDAVMHFAALSLVGESVKDPRRYFETNIAGGLRLIGACLDSGVGKFIFSSSAAVYGEPTTVPIPEDHALRPTSPYGATKVARERAGGVREGLWVEELRAAVLQCSGRTPVGGLRGATPS